jgi:NADPH2:quinone reductase
VALVVGIEQTGRSTLRAIWLNDFGGPERLVAAEAPDPVAGAGQALIEVAFANVTFADTMFRAGAFGPLEAKLPTIPGNGVGGVVASVGAGVENELVGRRVVTSTGGAGGYAERAAVDVGGLFVVPEHLGLDSAVALLADGRTATMLVRAAELGKRERVPVEAAAGGARKVELARGLGAEVAVDYREPGWTARVREAVGGVDVVFDGVGGDIAGSAFGLLRHGGRMLSFGMASGEWAGI